MPSAMMASGRVATNTRRQLARSTAIPPNAGPKAGARTTPMENKPIAVPRDRSGKVWKIRNIDIGCSRPAETPCKARAMISSSSEPLTAPSNEPMMKVAMPKTYVARGP